MFVELNKLIDLIQNEYGRITAIWKKRYPQFSELNFKKTLVRDIYDTDIIDAALQYRIFLNDEKLNFEIHLNNWDFKHSKVNTRVKEQNSIFYKINNYTNSPDHEFGKTAVNKCLNDLYGIRIVLDRQCAHDKIREYFIDNYPKLKCREGSKKDYIATHLYFKRDNHSFSWELQIWLLEHEQNNLNSHHKYKQEYVRWEEQAKEVKQND